MYFAVGSASSARASPARRRSFSARAAAGIGQRNAHRLDHRAESPSRGRRNRYFTNPSAARRRSMISSSGQTAAAAIERICSWDSPRTPSRQAAPSRCTRANTRRATSAPTPWGARAAAVSALVDPAKIDGRHGPPLCRRRPAPARTRPSFACGSVRKSPLPVACGRVSKGCQWLAPLALDWGF